MQENLSSLRGSVGDFSKPTGPDLLRRTRAYLEWEDSRKERSWWPYSRCLEGRTGPIAAVSLEDGPTRHGINFASQDYLSLATHDAVTDAAVEAARRYGVHSAGSPQLLGNTVPSRAIEHALADLLGLEHVLLFPTGWGAGFGAITGLVRRTDHVVMDHLAHACLQQGAAAATPNVSRYPHLDDGALEQRLREIRSSDPDNGILVVTEGLFSMDSDSPDLRRVQHTCRAWNATLLVDVAHDLGATGPGGTGELGAQRILGEVDLVMGSFSKTFASNGGFFASRERSVRQFMKWHGGPHVFSNAISPVQAAVVETCLRIVRSEEGERRRREVLANARALRDGLAQHGRRCLGKPSPIVPVHVGMEGIGRIASAILFRKGVFANLVEFPAVAVHAARFRMQVMAEHTADLTGAAARAVAESIAAAECTLAEQSA